MTFDIKTPADLFERVLLPTYQDFLANNARPAMRYRRRWRRITCSTG